MSNTSTCLDEIRSGAIYHWGKVIEIYEFGPYAIVEAYDWVSGKIGEKATNRVYFHAYVDGKETGSSFGRFDEAIAYCIAHKHEGPSTQAASYFMKMIGKK